MATGAKQVRVQATTSSAIKPPLHPEPSSCVATAGKPWQSFGHWQKSYV